MAGPQLTTHPQQDLQTRTGTTSGLALILALGTLIVLLGTNYISLTNDSFRNWAIQQLATRFHLVSSIEQRKADPRVVEVMAREAALITEINTLKGSVSALTIASVALRTANANLIAREQSTSAKLIIAEKRRLAGVAAAQRLGIRMEARVAKSLARQLATLPGKVLPAVGATVAVGSTVLELRDLCDNIRDIATLNVAVGLPTADDREVCGVQIGSVQTVVANAKQNIAATYASAMQAAGLAASPSLMPGQLSPSTPAPSVSKGAARAATANGPER